MIEGYQSKLLQCCMQYKTFKILDKRKILKTLGEIGLFFKIVVVKFRNTKENFF